MAISIVAGKRGERAKDNDAMTTIKQATHRIATEVEAFKTAEIGQFHRQFGQEVGVMLVARPQEQHLGR